MIAFLICHRVHIDHFENIWKFLDKKKFCLILFNSYNNFLGSQDCKKLLKYNHFFLENITDEIFEASVSMWPHDQIFKTNIFKKNFKQNILYSIIGSEDLLEKHHQAFSKKLYDSVLVFGNYSFKKLKSNFNENNIHILGNPRLDNWNIKKRNKEISSKRISLKFLYKLFLKKNKINILYMPSHGFYSSFENIIKNKKLDKLMKYCNFYLKPHPDVFSDKIISREIKKYNFKVVDKDFFLTKNFDDVDIILCDYGGSLLMPIIFDKFALMINNENNLSDLQLFLMNKGYNFCNYKNLNLFNILKSFSKKNRNVIQNLFKDFYISSYGNGKRIADFLNKL